VNVPVSELYDRIWPLALKGDAECGGLLSYGYVSGEHIPGIEEGRPLLVRTPESEFTLANVMRSHLFSALGALRMGLDILTEEEGVTVETLRGHGGFFTSAEVGCRLMAAATGFPVSVLETAGEGGAWGIALLAAFAVDPREQALPDYLAEVFAGQEGAPVLPDPADRQGFETYYKRFIKGLPIEKAAGDCLGERA
jgi:sugar (pentulose or hexulose) kinase